jgi:hypothetical protein
VLSTYNSALSSASTLFALELWQPLLDPDASPARLVLVGRVFGVASTVISMVLAPVLLRVEGIWEFQQKMNTIFSLPVVTLFLVGMFTTRPGPRAARLGFALGFVTYATAVLTWQTPYWLHVYGVSFVCTAALIYFVPLKEAPAAPLVGVCGSHLRGVVVVCVAVALLVVAQVAALQFATPGRIAAFFGLWGLCMLGLVLLPTRSDADDAEKKPVMAADVLTETRPRSTSDLFKVEDVGDLSEVQNVTGFFGIVGADDVLPDLVGASSLDGVKNHEETRLVEAENDFDPLARTP